MARLIIAGIIGGLAMFLWSFVSHTVLPLGEVGIKMMPNESAVLSTMKQNINEPGFYFYPGMDKSKGDVSEAEQNAWAEKYKAGPRGILIYHPTGEDPMSVGQLLRELVSNIIAALFAAVVISWLAVSFGRRIVAALLIGLVGWLSIDVSLWNWYGFPTGYMLAQGIDQAVGWLLAGLPPCGGKHAARGAVLLSVFRSA